jgi:hypothetical protein
MAFLGCGVMPCGTGHAGLYDPDDPQAVPVGNSTCCRWIGPQTGDYEIDPLTGHQRQMGAVLQRVLLALKTVKGSSSALPLLGVQLPRKMGTRFNAEVDAAVRDALRQLTDVERIIRIEAIEVERSMGRAAITVRYRNLLTGETEKAST